MPNFYRKDEKERGKFMKLGSGNNGQLTALDWIGIISFMIGLQNLDLNVSQQDIQNQTQDLYTQFNKQIRVALSEIHSHLEKQDDKINKILQILNFNQEKKSLDKNV